MLFNISTVCTCVNFVVCTYKNKKKCTVDTILTIFLVLTNFSIYLQVSHIRRYIFKFLEKMSRRFHTCLDDARRASLWREHSILTLQTKGQLLTLMAQKLTHSIFIKLFDISNAPGEN